MTTVSLVVAGIGIYTLYQAALEQQKQRLIETAQSQGRLIEAIAKNTKNSQTTLDTLIAGYEKFNDLAQTGELTLFKRDNEQIIFLIPHQHPNGEHFHSLSVKSKESEPFLQALSGKSGIFRGLDYSGDKVLAAYEPLAQLQWGLMVKKDLAEIHAPFLIAGTYTIFAAIIIDLLGAILFLGIGESRIEQLEESNAQVAAQEQLTRLNQQLEDRVQARTTELQNINEQLRLEIHERERLEEALRREIDLLARIMETSPVGIMMVNSQGNIILASEQAERVLGISLAKMLKPYNILAWKIFDEEGNSISNAQSPFQRVMQTRQPIFTVHHLVELPNEDPTLQERGFNKQLLLSFNASPLLNIEEEIEGVVLSIEDITERVQVEAALIHSEAQFRAIFEQAAVGMGIIALSGQFIRVNQRYCQLLGYSESELLSLTYQEITYPDDLLNNQEFVHQLIAENLRSGSVEKRYIRKNGEIKWVNLTASTVWDSQGNIKYLIGIVEDISDRKRTEEALRDSEERFRSIFKQAAVGIVQISLSGQLILFNDKFLDIVQYSATELQKKTVQSISHSDDFEQEYILMQTMLKGERDDFALEKRYLCQDGSFIWVHLSVSLVRTSEGQAMYFIGIVEDINERKKAIEDLRQSEEQYRRIIETTAEGVWIIDQDNLTTFVNQRMAQMLGYSLEEMKGRSLLDFVLPQEQARVTNSIKRRRPGIMDHHDFKMIRQDGSHLWTMMTTNPIYDYTGNYVGALVLLTDISERKKTEEALQQLNEQLTARVKELEQRHQDILLLNQVNDFLQACLNIEEAYEVIGELLQPLFPGCSGGLYMLNDSKTLLEAVVTWGENISSKSLFTFDECWALRRGYIHLVKPNQPSLLCLHTHRTPAPVESLCVPMMAQGKAVGLFYLSTSEPEKISEVKQQLARAVSEHISLALVNLQLRESLESQSIKDSLTGLYNRRYMEESLKREINLAQRKQHPVGLIMIDVDHFKQFNDNFGHKAGDLILHEVGNFLMANVRSGDIACRYGGEEFLLILPEASLSDSQQRAEQIRKGIKQLNFQQYNSAFTSLTVSIGVACFPAHGKQGETLIQSADMALYQAKNQGRDRVVVFSSVS
ncbi:PAS domain S-box protein [Gloeothece verrucosa]|nr:PAS domain S-box protein [Gloeothece verrucosa]